MMKNRIHLSTLTLKTGILLCLALVMGGILTGCIPLGPPINHRHRVVPPEHVASRNDQDWKLSKTPPRSQPPAR